MGAESICAFCIRDNGRCYRQERLMKRLTDLEDFEKRKEMGELLAHRLKGLSARLPTHSIDISTNGKMVHLCRDIQGGKKVTTKMLDFQRSCSDFDDGRNPNGIARLIGKR